MSNVIKSVSDFEWSHLGDIEKGRNILGPLTYVTVYRLMQYTLRSVMNKEIGIEKTNEIFIKSGEQAGFEFARNLLDLNLNFDEFISDLDSKLIDLKIGILRVESADTDKMEFVVTMGDDLDCSGLPFSGENVCEYDEGFIAGIFKAYTAKEFIVKEIDCWALGGRICRFHITLKDVY